MKFQPLISWWLIILYATAITAVAVWQFTRIRKQRRRSLLLYKAIFSRWLRRTVLLALPVLIAIGPSVQGGTSSPGVANLDVFFVVDTTPSMGAIDYVNKQQRLEGAKADIRALAKNLQGAHMEIISFDSEANVILPLTTDSTAFDTAVQGMTPQINSYSQGSTIDKPINLMGQELKNAQNAYPEHFRIVFYLGDGEQTAEAGVKSFEPVAKYVNGGAVMGYGTAKGAQMIKYEGAGQTTSKASYITTIDESTNQLTTAISRMDQTALKKIATQLKLTYQDRNQGGAADGLYQASKAQLAVDRSQRVVHYLNMYWLCAIPLVGLIFWEWQSLIVKLFELRDHHDKSGKTAHKRARHAR